MRQILITYYDKTAATAGDFIINYLKCKISIQRSKKLLFKKSVHLKIWFFQKAICQSIKSTAIRPIIKMTRGHSALSLMRAVFSFGMLTIYFKFLEETRQF